MKVKFEDGKMKMETVRESAEDSLRSDELNLAVLKEMNLGRDGFVRSFSLGEM
ncbi:fructokinase-2 [Trifolium medium]|uniref:Fructokinase-2 n=1 Tax=Trifolium medium TaxID=97028 RepID=A0A392ML04_9FABA|nr:fructokinase-2 [Trifolium medium]